MLGANKGKKPILGTSCNAHGTINTTWVVHIVVAIDLYHDDFILNKFTLIFLYHNSTLTLTTEEIR